MPRKKIIEVPLDNKRFGYPSLKGAHAFIFWYECRGVTPKDALIINEDIIYSSHMRLIIDARFTDVEHPAEWLARISAQSAKNMAPEHLFDLACAWELDPDIVLAGANVHYAKKADLISRVRSIRLNEFSGVPVTDAGKKVLDKAGGILHDFIDFISWISFDDLKSIPLSFKGIEARKEKLRATGH